MATDLCEGAFQPNCIKTIENDQVLTSVRVSELMVKL